MKHKTGRTTIICKRLLLCAVMLFFICTKTAVAGTQAHASTGQPESSRASRAAIKNAEARQEGNRAVFHYDLVGEHGYADVDVSITIDGNVYSAESLYLEGDYSKVATGRGKKIYWNVTRDYPSGFGDDIAWEITAKGLEPNGLAQNKKFDVFFRVTPPGAMLVVDGRVVEVDDQGFAGIQSLAAKPYNYWLRAEGFESRSGRFNPADNQIITADLPPKDAFYGLQTDFFRTVSGIKNDFGVRLWSERSQYRVGDTIAFYFQAEQDCYLYLVSINSRGELTLLFPNRYHRENFIRAGRVYRLPDDQYGFEFEIQPPIGTDRVYAIAGSTPMDLFESNFEEAAFTAYTRGKTFEATARSIGVRLKNTRLNAAAQYVIRVNE